MTANASGWVSPTHRAIAPFALVRAATAEAATMSCRLRRVLGAAVLAGITALALMVGAAAAGLDELEGGPKIGAAIIPHSLDAPDQHGRQRDFESLAGRHGLVLLFTHSFDW